jgi:hypothetical protein
MPKIYMPKALEVVQLFAAQRAAINISLSAVGLLWNATDLIGRSRAAAAAATAAAATAAANAAAAAAAVEPQPIQSSSSGVGSTLGGIFSVLSLSRRPTVDEAVAKTAAVAAATAGSVGSSSPAKQDASAAAGSGAAARAGSPLGTQGAGSAAADVNGAGAGGADPHLAGRSDLLEEECTELLIRVFEHLRVISVDKRPEVSVFEGIAVCCDDVV